MSEAHESGEPAIRTAVDLFAHTNPAFVSAVVHWTCAGYREIALKAGIAPELALPWCIVSVALIAPDAVRDALPETAARRLPNLIADHPDWKYSLADAVRLWVPAFWSGMRYGITKGTLRFSQGRVSIGEKLRTPTTAVAVAVHKKAITMGKIFANEGSDAAISLALGLEVQR